MNWYRLFPNQNWAEGIGLWRICRQTVLATILIMKLIFMTCLCKTKDMSILHPLWIKFPVIFFNRVANSNCSHSALPSAGPPATQDDADDDDDAEVTLSVGGVGVSGSKIQKANPMTGSKKIAIVRNRTNHCSSCQAGLWHLLSSNFPSYTHHPSIEKSHSCSSGLRSCWSKRPCHWIFGRTVLGLWVWAYRCVLIICGQNPRIYPRCFHGSCLKV